MQGPEEDDNLRVRSAFSDDETGVRSMFSDDETDSEDLGSDSEDSEDNVPLAQRIPGALQAQKTIRTQDRAERERRRKEKQALKQKARAPQRHLAPEELTQKLLREQVSSSAALRTTGTLRRPADPRNPSPQPRYVSQGQSDVGNIANDTSSVPLARQPTTAQPRNKSVSHAVPQPSSPSRPPVRPHPPPALSQQVVSRKPSTMHHQQASMPIDTHLRRSLDTQEKREAEGVMRSRTMSSSVRPTQRVLQRVRTLDTSPPPVPQDIKKTSEAGSTQHRVFIGDMQRFNTIEIGPQTRARDVLDLVEAQGELRGEPAARPGGWMLWEIAQDFGMERPLRDFELPAEVYATWNSNTRLNSFMIKKTPLASLLAKRAMPTSSPTYSGHVQWESKRGKWNKRWMELREHSLWLSKRDNGKDSTFLCSLSNFDCYYVSRLHKAPKPFVFAVKSSDNLTLFENPADYLHVFACDPNDGQRWIERVLLARSYVLHKERTILFAAAVSAPGSSPSTGHSNQNTNKSSSRAAAKLVDVNAIQTPDPPSTTKHPFQSGSLLAKASI